MAKLQQKAAHTAASDIKIKGTAGAKTKAGPTRQRTRKIGSPRPTRTRRRHQTKQGRILELLQRPKGASITDLTKATGWQPP